MAVFFLAVGLLDLKAVEPARETPEPANTATTTPSDTASTNLTQIGTKKSPLSDLESGLKRPFDIFQRGTSSDDLRPASRGMRYVPPAPVLNNQKLRELLDKRAAAKYLLPDESATALPGDDIFRSDEDSISSSGERPKSALDRYYDRRDQLKSGPTNQTTRSLDFFGSRKEAEDQDDPKPKQSGGLFANEFSASARGLGQNVETNSGGGFLSSEKSGPRSFGEIFGLSPAEPTTPAARPRDTRLDDFKRLLDGPGVGSRNEFNVAPPASTLTPYQAQKPVTGVPSPTFSTTPPAALGGSPADSQGFAGNIGAPVGVPDYAKGTPSLTPTPPVQKATPRPPPPTFNVPRRRF